MKLLRPSALFTVIFVLGAALAAFAQSFAVTATPVNSGSSGTVSVKYSVTGIPAAGTLVVSCQYAGSSTYQEQNRLPICGVGPIAGVPVTTGQSVTGGLSIVPWGTPVPAASTNSHTTASQAPASALVLAGALLLGFTLRCKDSRWFSMMLIAVGTLSIAAGISACGGSSPNGSMPGVYPYTVTARVETSPVTPVGISVSTTVMVTVP